MTTSTSLDAFLGAAPDDGKRKWLIRGGLALIVIIALLVALAVFQGGETSGYATEKVQQGNLEVTVSATGHLAPTNKVDVGSEVSGLVEHVYVDANDRVTQGQVLARLDTSRLTDAVSRAQAQLAAANAAKAQANATLHLAKANLNRQMDVFRMSGGKVPSATELDTARAQVAQSTAAMQSAQAQIMQARAQLKSDQTNLAKATIVSPVTGVVLSREIEQGQTVAASFNTPKLFVIAEDLSHMKLEASVDEADVGQVAPGQSATFKVDAYPGRKFPASIQRINLGATSSSSSSASNSNNVVSYTAMLKVDNKDLTLRPGLTATADIVTASRKNVLLVPNAALRFTPPATKQKGVLSSIGPGAMFGERQKVGKTERGSVATLYTLDAQGQPKALTVTVGATNGKQTEVSGADLRTGMDVITSMLAAKE